MSMTPYNSDIKLNLKWLQAQAQDVQDLIQAKSDWYNQNETLFWKNWQTSVFDLRTATPFGIMVWCIILGVPAQSFGLYPASPSWAFGSLRENFIYSGTDPNFKNPSTGGNFYGGGSAEVLDLDEIRNVLRTRYVALVSNGSIKFVNEMLRYIWNKNQPWDVAGGRYFYAVDCTSDVSPRLAPFVINYHIGPNMGLSAQLINVLNSTSMGIMPTNCGSKSTVIQD